MPPFHIAHVTWDANMPYATRRATKGEIEEVLYSSATSFRRNLPGRAASHVARGRTRDGERITVAFTYLREYKIAIPITAWRNS